ncbi:hypothetical protein DVK85_02910 [Flavobacterium arcticum]|uniref:Adenylosuccinate lyase n=1 Tax=Flavobacterium arcticum TaxID=1784713 RepID=A0A345H9H3_9FLAO|nr:hypothetical protein [Flavobacterium arcticum]AXG73233.1 hypothetical protein DVK85_02910 [Flavobacterium arcticum]KAF2513026.1 hypothetical protein E0W72_00975 [Flavobacterium arcticum]
MHTTFYTKIINSNARRSIRDELSKVVLSDKGLFPDLINIAFDINDKNHHKACWILELVCEARITWLKEHLTEFCNTLPLLKNDSAIRPIAKVCTFAIKHHAKDINFLNDKQLQQITEACFDWVINPDEKVAAKVYAIQSLYLLGKSNEWIYPELQPILELDFSKHTAAYKATAKDVLRKIARQQKKH